MKRQTLMALREPEWVTLFPNEALEVRLVPSEMPDLTTAKFLGINSEHIAREICTNAFVDFKGYVDDADENIPNTLETRIELYSFPAVRKSIQNALEVRNLEAVTGEPLAV